MPADRDYEVRVIVEIHRRHRTGRLRLRSTRTAIATAPTPFAVGLAAEEALQLSLAGHKVQDEVRLEAHRLRNLENARKILLLPTGTHS